MFQKRASARAPRDGAIRLQRQVYDHRCGEFPAGMVRIDQHHWPAGRFWQRARDCPRLSRRKADGRAVRIERDAITERQHGLPIEERARAAQHPCKRGIR